MTTKSVPVPTSFCRFGFARREITPPVGIYHRCWGAASHDQATGVHRPIYADVLVLGPLEGGERQAAGGDGDRLRVQVQLDLGWLHGQEIQPLREAAAEGAGVRLDQVLVGCNHSHSAANVMLNRVGEPGGDRILPYLETLRGQLAEAARGAVADLAPAAISYGTGRCSLAVNRDYWDGENGIFVCGYNPDTPGDDTVLVGAVFREDRRAATIVNYGCHPTSLAWGNSLISPDYYGACRETVEHATGAPCLFLLGACGDLAPRVGYVGDTAVADRNGRQLGYAALSALEALGPPGSDFVYTGPVVSGATLGAWEYRPCSPERRRQAEQFSGGSFKLPLPVKPLPTRDEVVARRAQHTQQEAAALAAGDTGRARDLRALVERDTRLLARLDHLPEGSHYPLEAAVWRIGDAVWVTVEGEVYNAFQTDLRRRFPGTPILVTPLTNGWDPTYLPPRELYGKGIYQEEIALLAPGCLEAITEETARRVERLLQD